MEITNPLLFMLALGMQIFGITTGMYMYVAYTTNMHFVMSTRICFVDVDATLIRIQL